MTSAGTTWTNLCRLQYTFPVVMHSLLLKTKALLSELTNLNAGKALKHKKSNFRIQLGYYTY